MIQSYQSADCSFFSNDELFKPNGTLVPNDIAERFLHEQLGGQVICVKTPAIGDCCWSSCSIALTGRNEYMMQLRYFTAIELMKNPGRYEQYLGVVPEYMINHLLIASTPREWGTEMELYALSNILQRHIYVYIASHSNLHNTLEYQCETVQISNS